MEIVHTVALNGDSKPDFIASLDRLEIEYDTSPLPGGVIGLVYFDISESDVRWSAVEVLIRTRGASDVVNTLFTRQEILEAHWLRLVPGYQSGYPQPVKRWQQRTYQSRCPQCGLGYLQIAPFRLKKEPRMARNDFLSLYWTWTVFCTTRVINALAASQIRGFQVWDAVLHKTNEPSHIVSQLVFPAVSEPGLADIDKQKAETCTLCDTTKYAPHMRGYMHLARGALQLDMDFQLTSEWFGSGGHGGWREIVVSSRLARLILDEGWRGVSLKPIKLV